MPTSSDVLRAPLGEQNNHDEGLDGAPTQDVNSSETKRKRKKKIRPKLKPISSVDDGFERERSGTASSNDDLGFGNWASSSMKSNAPAEDDIISSEIIANETSNPTTAVNNDDVTTPPPKTRLKPRTSSRIQPRSTLFSPNDSPHSKSLWACYSFNLYSISPHILV